MELNERGSEKPQRTFLEQLVVLLEYGVLCWSYLEYGVLFSSESGRYGT